MLIANASGVSEQISTIVYTIGLAGLLGVSALYHRPNWSINKRKWMRRLDHSMIFVLIAGTMTPVCLLVLSETSGLRLLTIAWAIAGLGIVQTLFWTKTPKWLSAIMYMGFGWIIFPFLSEMQAALSFGDMLLLFFGGLSYTVGAITYALKWPNPSPKFFGYHEIFHLLVVLGALFHFIMVASMVNN